MAEEILAANGNGGTNAWLQKNGAIQEYQNIDDTSLIAANSSNDWIYTTFSARNSLFAFADTDDASGATINSVTVHIAAKEDNTAFVKYIVDVDGDNGIDDTSGAQALTTTLTEYTNEYTTNPDTTNAWTSGEIDAAHFGVQSNIPLGRGNQAYVYAIWLVVDYDAAGYGNLVSGIASGDIAKINGVATANITKVNGV